MQVKNCTPGPIFVDVPRRQTEEEIDPVARALASIDVSADVSPADALRTLVALELAKKQSADLERELLRSSLRRAKDTVDLWPAHQGEGQPSLVNEISDEKWRAIERMPAIAARLASGALQVIGYPATYAPF